MGNSVYEINKGINKPIEFKGLKAQYIWYLAGGIVCLLIVFAILYIIGINPFICVAIILVAGTVLVLKVYAMSNKYGEHGMMKKLAHRSIPTAIKSNTRKKFKNLSNAKVSR
jgi:predicted lysophospholipase L1 biosynthesis ABC-type transport system permease subunit